MNRSRNTVHILSSLAIILLIAIQMVDSYKHAFFYHFITWFTWPAIFFVAGYIMVGKPSIKKSFFDTVKAYLIPYFISGIALIFLNKLVQILGLSPWLNSPFPAIRVGLKALLYGNGWPAHTLIWPYETGIGLFWVLLALFCGSTVNIIIVQVKSITIQVISVLAIAILGFYLGSFIQLPWSIQSAMIVQPFMLYGSYFDKLKNWQPSFAAILVAVISAWIMSYADVFEATTAFSYHWILTMILAFIALNAMLAISWFINNRVSKLANKLVLLAQRPNINIIILGFISSMIPISFYISKIPLLQKMNFEAIWLITLIIMISINILMNKVLHNEKKREGDFDEKDFN
ncbi:hypothetical protein [Weissella paramesenteroides]|jgi:hypothetical protein|uniref:hypothetical protein n=1 Tax=Weissella paramesenteroides TaxID=1249 RepID=UPI00388D5578